MISRITSPSIVITGGSGFIGAHLCRALARAFNVINFDIKPLHIPEVSYCYRAGDVRRFEELVQVVRQADFVFHLAAISSVPACEKKPADSFQTNVMGCRNLVKAIKQVQKERQKRIPFLFASSSSVYGEQNRKVREETPVNPLSEYARQKTLAESLFIADPEVQGFVYRFFNIYGQGLTGETQAVIPSFVRNIYLGQPLIVEGTGIQKRDFLHIEDTISVLKKALRLLSTQSDSRLVNVGSGYSTSVLDLIRALERLANLSVQVRFALSRPGDIRSSVADISLANKLLGWSPCLSLEEGLRLSYKKELGQVNRLKHYLEAPNNRFVNTKANRNSL